MTIKESDMKKILLKIEHIFTIVTFRAFYRSFLGCYQMAVCNGHKLRLIFCSQILEECSTSYLVTTIVSQAI